VGEQKVALVWAANFHTQIKASPLIADKGKRELSIFVNAQNHPVVSWIGTWSLIFQNNPATAQQPGGCQLPWSFLLLLTELSGDMCLSLRWIYRLYFEKIKGKAQVNFTQKQAMKAQKLVEV
jgi:hypothetical protein